MGTVIESDNMGLDPSMIVENTRDYLMFTGKNHQVAYIPSTATVLKIPEDVLRILGFCAVPRTLAAVSHYLQIGQEGYPTENNFNDCMRNLLRSGVLKSDNTKIQLRKAKWVRQHFDGNAPKLAALHLTFRCNLTCDYCYNGDIRNERLTEDRAELSTDDWDKIITDLIGSGVKELDITGGEPLLRLDVFPLLAKVKNSGITIHLITNGQLITPENVNEIKSSVSQVSLSLDSYCENEHDMHRGIGTHQRVVEAGKLLTKNDIPWGTMMVYNIDTCASFNETRNFVRNLGGQFHNASIQSFPRVPSDVRKVFAALEIEEVSVYRGGRLVCNDPLANTDEQRIRENASPHYCCSAARTECAIDPYGNLYPCRLLMVDSLNGGNLMINDFMDIWLNSENLDKARYFDYTSIKKCKGCDFFLHCLGGCRGSAIMGSGELSGAIPIENCIHMKQLAMVRILNAIGEI